VVNGGSVALVLISCSWLIKQEELMGEYCDNRRSTHRLGDVVIMIGLTALLVTEPCVRRDRIAAWL